MSGSGSGTELGVGVEESWLRLEIGMVVSDSECMLEEEEAK